MLQRALPPVPCDPPDPLLDAAHTLLTECDRRLLPSRAAGRHQDRRGAVPWPFPSERLRRPAAACDAATRRCPREAHAECPNCGELKRPHHVCSHCGYLRRARGRRRRQGAEGRGSRLTPGSRRGRSPPLTATFTLAVDAMGGDHAPLMVVEGLEIAAERHPGARFLLVGDEAQLDPLLRRAPPRRCRLHDPARARGDQQRHQADRRAAGARLLDARRDRRGGRRARRPAWSRPATPARCWRWPRSSSRRCPGIDRPAMAAIGPSARGDVVHAGSRRQRAVRRAQPGRVRRDGRRVRAHRAGPDRAVHRPAERRLRGAEGRRHAAAGGRDAARQPYRAAVRTASSRATTSPPAPPTWW